MAAAAAVADGVEENPRKKIILVYEMNATAKQRRTKVINMKKISAVALVVVVAVCLVVLMRFSRSPNSYSILLRYLALYFCV